MDDVGNDIPYMMYVKKLEKSWFEITGAVDLGSCFFFSSAFKQL